MKIIVSPAKKMSAIKENFPATTKPQFLTEAETILAKMKSLSYDEAKEMWHCSEKLARPNYAWLQQMDLSKDVVPAITSYIGIQYQYMAPDLFTKKALDYVGQNLRILSGFYGVLRPFDGVVPYRLSLDSPLSVDGQKNLYDFWGAKIYEALEFDQNPVLNLASIEYSKAIRPYLKETDQLVDVLFYTNVAGKLKVKATHAKMARGMMVRFLAENDVNELAGVTKFWHPEYKYRADLSTASKIVFVSEN